MNFQEFQDMIEQQRQHGTSTVPAKAQQTPHVDIPEPKRKPGQGLPCTCDCCAPGAHCKNKANGCMRVRDRRTKEQLENAERYPGGMMKPRRDKPTPITPAERRRRMDRRNERTRQRRREQGVTARGPRPHKNPSTPNLPETLEAASAARAAKAAPAKVVVPEAPPKVHWWVQAKRSGKTITLAAPKGETEAHRMADALRANRWVEVIVGQS